MIVCSCTGATDRDVRAGSARIGKCGGCAPTVKELKRAQPLCLLCSCKVVGGGVQLLGRAVCAGCSEAQLTCHKCRKVGLKIPTPQGCWPCDQRVARAAHDTLWKVVEQWPEGKP